jgi:hypothetical protein
MTVYRSLQMSLKGMEELVESGALWTVLFKVIAVQKARSSKSWYTLSINMFMVSSIKLSVLQIA